MKLKKMLRGFKVLKDNVAFVKDVTVITLGWLIIASIIYQAF